MSTTPDRNRPSNIIDHPAKTLAENERGADIETFGKNLIIAGTVGLVLFFVGEIGAPVLVDYLSNLVQIANQHLGLLPYESALEPQLGQLADASKRMVEFALEVGAGLGGFIGIEAQAIDDARAIRREQRTGSALDTDDIDMDFDDGDYDA